MIPNREISYEQTAEILSTRSCYECAYGCTSAVNCTGDCLLAEATKFAVDILNSCADIINAQKGL